MAATNRQVSPPARETVLLAGLAVAGAVAVLLVLFGDSPFGTLAWTDYTSDRKEVLRGPRWSLWVALVVGQGALWGVLLPLLLRAHARLRGEVSANDILVTLSPLTRAITIDAPASAVWPWIAQMGPSPRGGAYTYDWIENLLGTRHA